MPTGRFLPLAELSAPLAELLEIQEMAGGTDAAGISYIAHHRSEGVVVFRLTPGSDWDGNPGQALEAEPEGVTWKANAS